MVLVIVTVLGLIAVIVLGLLLLLVIVLLLVVLLLYCRWKNVVSMSLPMCLKARSFAQRRRVTESYELVLMPVAARQVAAKLYTTGNPTRSPP